MQKTNSDNNDFIEIAQPSESVNVPYTCAREFFEAERKYGPWFTFKTRHEQIFYKAIYADDKRIGIHNTGFMYITYDTLADGTWFWPNGHLMCNKKIR